MMRYSRPDRCLGALILLVLMAHLVLVPPTPAHAESVESLKEEQQMRHVEEKLEADNDASNGNGGIRTHSNLVNGYRRNQRSIGLGPRFFPISRSKIPIELELLVNNEDSERTKRFDDYGHMRFGKRGNDEQFDDYGHMRFGR